MLSPAESDLVRRDPAVPGLAVLLDPNVFIAALRARLPEADLETAKITYIKYKPGTNCLVGYNLTAAGTTVRVYGKAYRTDARNKLQKALQQPGAAGLLGPGRIVLEDCAAVISVFPNDGKVKSLSFLDSSEARERLLSQLLPERPDLQDGEIEGLVYKPERRYVARLIVGGEPCAALKMYTERDYLTVRDKAGRFRSRGVLRFARQLGYSDRHCTLAFEWLPGRLLSESILDPEPDLEAVAAVGAALAELHAQNVEGLTCLTREEEMSGILSSAREVGMICPRLAEQADGLARRITARLAQEPVVYRPIHGDFHARQVLTAPDSVTVLDVDRALYADPRVDLCLFIAHLEREVIRGNLSPSRVEPLKRAFLEGYQHATHDPAPALIELYVAAEVLRLSPRFFRYFEPAWLEKIEASLERVEAILQMIPSRLYAVPPPKSVNEQERDDVEHSCE